MLCSPTEMIITKENIPLKSSQYILLNNLVKHDRYYDDIGRVKDRLEKSLPNMQQVIHADMERTKINKIYDRKLKHDLTGPRGLDWQCRQELQRLRNDERDLIRLNRDSAKVASLSSISQFPSSHQSKESSRNHTPRLSSIAEENSSLPIMEKSKSILGRSLSLNPSRASISPATIVSQKRSSMHKNDSHREHLNWLRKHSFPQIVARTSGDRLNRQQHAYIINQQKQLVEQKLQQFLHGIK